MARLLRPRNLLGACSILVIAAAAAVWLVHSSSARAVNVDLFGVAIGGYDPVAYFTLNRAVKGSSEHELEWNDATWRFISDEHRERFASDPTRYAPQYGGFCAAGLAMGGKWKADPEVWKIVDGKLFLNFNKAGLEELVADPRKVIDDANKTWQVSRPSG